MAQTVLSSDTTPWKALTEKLPGVLSVEFVTEGPVVREVHVLSDQSRSPKQIVRDIQSALLARFPGSSWIWTTGLSAWRRSPAFPLWYSGG